MVRWMSLVIALAALVLAPTLFGQSTPDTTQAHCAAAKAVAGTEHINLYNRFAEVCGGERPTARGAQPRRGGPPPQTVWHHEPVRVFDISTSRHQGAFVVGVQTSDGSSSSTRSLTTP